MTQYVLYIHTNAYLPLHFCLFIPFFDIALRILNFEYYMREKTKLQYKQFFLHNIQAEYDK